MRKWYLMRHGQTDYNKKRCFYGSDNVSINKTGIQQAKALAAIMKDQPVSAVFTSQLKRSQETAQQVFPHQAFRALSDFDERDFGLWEGLNADEIEAAFPNIWQEWLTAPFSVTPPQAEPFSLFQERVWKAVDMLLKQEKENIAIVAHLGVLRLIYQHLVNQDADFWMIDIPQGSVLVLEEESGQWKHYSLGKEVTNNDTHSG